MSRRWRWGARLLGILVVALGSGAPVAGAAGAGDLQIHVVNGTPGGGPVGGLPLTIYQVVSDQQQIVGRGHTDAAGGFVWSAPAAPIDARYVVSTTYRGAAYSTAPQALPARPVTLPVYEATDDVSTLRLATAGIVIVGVDPATQRIQVLETATLENTGARSFVPRTDGPRGAMGLLRFGLPDGAGDLTPGGRLAASTLIQVNTGFATDLPVPPGTTDVSYTYALAYGALTDGGYAALTKTVPYPVATFRVLVPNAPFAVSSPQLRAAGTATVGGRTYRLYEGQNLPAHSEVTIELRDLPLNQPWLRSNNPWIQAGLGLFLLAALGGPALYARRVGRAIAARLPAAVADAPDALPAGGSVTGYPKAEA